MNKERDQDGQNRQLIRQDVEQGAKSESPALPPGSVSTPSATIKSGDLLDLVVTQSLDVSLEVVFKGIELIGYQWISRDECSFSHLDDLDAQQKLFDGGNSGISTGRPSFITPVDVPCHVGGHRCGNWDASNANDCAYPQHGVQETDTDGH